MKIKAHLLKTEPRFFQDVATGWKTFEVRRNDRDYRLNDILILAEWNPQRQQYEDQSWMMKTVCYVLSGGQYGIEPGYCVLGLSELGIRYSYDHQLELYEQAMLSPDSCLEISLA